MNEVLAIIPARSGSKGILDKNIKKLGNHSLLGWAIQSCKKAKLIDRVLVSTDSLEYSKLAIEYGAEVPFIRPENISADNSTDYDFIKHLLDWLKENGGEPKYIIHIRPTTPLRNPKLIDEALVIFKKSVEATSLRSVHEMSESAYKTFEFNNNGYLKSLGLINNSIDFLNKPRQSFPKTYQANGYVDILSVSYIRLSKKLHGNRVLPFITPYVHEVDTLNDFKFLEFQIQDSPNTETLMFGE